MHCKSYILKSGSPAYLDSWLLHVYFNLAGLQLAVGQFGVSLFPLVPRMRFSQDCLAATLYLVCSLLISQSNNMGDKILGCASLIGPAWLGAIFGGCVVRMLHNDASHVKHEPAASFLDITQFESFHC